MEIKIYDEKFAIGEYSIAGNYCDGYMVWKTYDDEDSDTLYYNISLESCIVWCLNHQKCISSKIKQDNLKIIKTVLDTVEREDTAEIMTEYLYDEGNSTYKMFEELAMDYLNGNDDKREGIDTACSILTGWRLPTIAKKILERVEE